MFLIPLSPPVVCELQLPEGQRTVSTADQIQSEYDQKQLSLSNCWTLDHWMSSGSLAGVTPLTRLANLPRPEMCSTLHWKIFLCTTLAIHTRHCHEPSKTNIC